jgi:hypothetical protein
VGEEVWGDHGPKTGRSATKEEIANLNSPSRKYVHIHYGLLEIIPCSVFHFKHTVFEDKSVLEYSAV